MGRVSSGKALSYHVGPYTTLVWNRNLLPELGRPEPR